MKLPLDFFEISLLIQNVWYLDCESYLKKIMKHKFVMEDKERLHNILTVHRMFLTKSIHLDFFKFLKRKTRHKKFNFYEADFNETLILIKSCWCAGTGLRMSFLEKIISNFNKFSTKEVCLIWNEIKDFIPAENSEYQNKFFARFNTDNQYSVTGKYLGRTQMFVSYLFNNEYFIDFRTSIFKDYIIDINKINYEK